MRAEQRAKVRSLAHRSATRARELVDDLDERDGATETEQALVVAVRLLSAAVDRLADLSEAQEVESV